MPTDDSLPETTGPPNIPQVIIQQQATMFGRFGKLLLIALAISLMVIASLTASYQSYFNPTDGPQEKYHSLSREATKKIAIIDVSGPLLDGEGFVKKQIDRVREDDDVVGVVLRIDSPGGTITASDYIHHHLTELREERELPMVVSMGSLCASGGYYVAMAVGDEPDRLYAEPTTWTGSIGVIIPHFDLSGLLDRFDIKDDSIASGELKQMGTPTRPMSDKERQLLETLVDESFDDFKQVVIAGRARFQNDPAALDEVATGQIFTAEQGLQNGLVDKIGFVEAAIERVAELAGHDPDELRCVRYKQPLPNLLTLLGSQAAPDRSTALDLAGMLDLATPRGYYLFTWLPAALTSAR